MKAQLEQTAEKGKTATGAELKELYDALRTAYTDFLANGRNKGGVLTNDDAIDLTEEQLVEAQNFTRADDSGNERFGTPKYWTVENYQIPSATEGVRGGLDSYPGRDCLTLGIWNDRGNAPEESDITAARVYRKVSLGVGRYFFGGIYNTIYNQEESYVFAASATMATTDIGKNAIAYMKVNECVADGNYWGIYFTLDEPQDILLGWQGDLLHGANTQEFRVEKIKLAQLDGGIPDAIIDMDADFDAPVEIYSLQGVRLGSIPQHGFFIVKKGTKTMKCYRR